MGTENYKEISWDDPKHSEKEKAQEKFINDAKNSILKLFFRDEKLL